MVLKTIKNNMVKVVLIKLNELELKLEREFELLNIVNTSWNDLDLSKLSNPMNEKELYNQYTKVIGETIDHEREENLKGLYNNLMELNGIYREVKRIVKNR